MIPQKNNGKPIENGRNWLLPGKNIKGGKNILNEIDEYRPLVVLYGLNPRRRQGYVRYIQIHPGPAGLFIEGEWVKGGGGGGGEVFPLVIYKGKKNGKGEQLWSSPSPENSLWGVSCSHSGKKLITFLRFLFFRFWIFPVPKAVRNFNWSFFLDLYSWILDFSCSHSDKKILTDNSS